MLLSFETALKETQGYISNRHNVFIDNSNSEKNKETLKSYIEHFLFEKGFEVKGYTTEELADRIFEEMSGFSFLSKYLKRDDIEEININAWNDIKISYADGSVRRSEEIFLSPNHAIDTFKKLLHESGMVIDKSSPIVRGHLSNKIRITVLGEGVTDKNVGIAASIRIVNPKKFTREEFIQFGTLTAEMMDFIETIYKFGTSVCFAGSVFSGKTTLLSHILSTVSDDKRLVTIEQETREFNLKKYDENGLVINNVLHLVTRPSDDPTKNIDMTKLLETALTINPDYMTIAEMKGNESFTAIAAANTDLPMTTTIHCNSCRDAYHRMMTLSKSSTNMNDETLLELSIRAFPIVVFSKRMDDNVRRITEIAECVGIRNNQIEMNTLFRYKIKSISERDEKGKVYVDGTFEKVGTISDRLKEKLINAGITEEAKRKIW